MSLTPVSSAPTNAKGGWTYPEALAIEPLSRAPRTTIKVPGSKSMTNRALILAALSEPDRGGTITGVLVSEDTEVMMDALRALGFRIHVDRGEPGAPALSAVSVRRGNAARPIPKEKADLFVGNSGTSMRFLTALVSVGEGRYRLDGVSRMRERPIGALLSALEQLGVHAYSERGNGYPPVIVETGGLGGGTATISGDVSSQFLSGLLMAAPFARRPVTLQVAGHLVSEPYVRMTIEMMRRFGITVESTATSHFTVPAVACYQSRTYEIEPDASAASYFLAAAAITGGEVVIPGLGSASLQGDVQFARVLEEMGAQLSMLENGVKVTGGRLGGIEVDMRAISDCVMTLAAVACFAEGPTTIRNIAHIRYKETDRLAALAAELTRVGALAEELADGLRITPRPLRGATIETYNDHRMAMSMSLVGLKVPGIVIRNPGCVAKTYPGFFDDLEKLRTEC
jgi:3-phosphoshikimate 1-carboxyvinyltransferase